MRVPRRYEPPRYDRYHLRFFHAKRHYGHPVAPSPVFVPAVFPSGGGVTIQPGNLLLIHKTTTGRVRP